MKGRCQICPHHCVLEVGQIGFCNARGNVDGEIVCLNYGKLTAIALDPIEKKPLAHYMPGSMVLSVGSYGCNLRCPFCQNCSISMANAKTAKTVLYSPQQLISKALELLPLGNIGIAYTYNEPLIGYEYLRDCARLAHAVGMKNILVTNGYICEEPLRTILPLIDAMNIDLKSFSEAFYNKLAGDIDTVKRTIEIAAAYCHVEVTTLIIPDENDDPDEMAGLSQFLAGISEDIPLHLSRFFPCHQYSDKNPTPRDTIYKLRDIAKRYLNYVYTGNL